MCLPWLLQTYGTIIPESTNYLWKLRKKCNIKFITFGSALAISYPEKQRFEEKLKQFQVRSFHFRNEHNFCKRPVRTNSSTRDSIVRLAVRSFSFFPFLPLSYISISYFLSFLAPFSLAAFLSLFTLVLFNSQNQIL